jgi:hypothetical protein
MLSVLVRTFGTRVAGKTTRLPDDSLRLDRAGQACITAADVVPGCIDLCVFRDLGEEAQQQDSDDGDTTENPAAATPSR